MQLVSLVAVAAMEHGRQVLRARQMQSGTQLGDAAVVAVQRLATARFWDLLSAACALGLLPQGHNRSTVVNHAWCLIRRGLVSGDQPQGFQDNSSLAHMSSVFVRCFCVRVCVLGF